MRCLRPPAQSRRGLNMWTALIVLRTNRLNTNPTHRIRRMWTLIGLSIAGVLAVGVIVVRVKLWRQLPPVAHGLRGVLRRIWRIARPAVVLIAGLSLVLVGIVAIPLPGPGWAIVFAGIALLATEFVWARWLLTKTRDTAISVGRICGFGSLPPPNAGRLRLFIHRWNLVARKRYFNRWKSTPPAPSVSANDPA